MGNDKSAALWVTANERFKSKSGDWMAIGAIAAVSSVGLRRLMGYQERATPRR